MCRSLSKQFDYLVMPKAKGQLRQCMLASEQKRERQGRATHLPV